MNEPQLTVTEAARIAGVSAATVRRWCDLGQLPHQRTSGGVHLRLILDRHLRAFLGTREHRAGSPQEPRS